MNDNPSDTARILRKAADYIGEHGHHKGGFHYRGAVCARGAINAVLYGDPDDCGYDLDSPDGQADEVAQTLADHLGLKPNEVADGLARLIVTIGRWNDSHTAEEVITALRECATELAGTAR